MDDSKLNETTRDRQRDATRQRLYDASITIFKRDGFRAARVDDITLVAGVSRTAFYFHFPTKEDVLLDYMSRHEARITEALQVLPTKAPVADVVEVLVNAMAREWEDDRSLLVDALAVTLRQESEGKPPPRPLQAELEQRLGGATVAEQCLLALTTSATAFQPDRGVTFLDGLRAAARTFLGGLQRSP